MITCAGRLRRGEGAEAEVPRKTISNKGVKSFRKYVSFYRRKDIIS
jgi:hypothetical protein